jgi:hypothetical protein
MLDGGDRFAASVKAGCYREMGNRDRVHWRGVEEVVRKFGGYGDWFTVLERFYCIL